MCGHLPDWLSCPMSSCSACDLFVVLLGQFDIAAGRFFRSSLFATSIARDVRIVHESWVYWTLNRSIVWVLQFHLQHLARGHITICHVLHHFLETLSLSDHCIIWISVIFGYMLLLQHVGLRNVLLDVRGAQDLLLNREWILVLFDFPRSR